MGMSTEKLPRSERAFENRGPLEIHIEKLVFHGFPNVNHKKFQSAIESELARLLHHQQPPVVWEKLDKISQVDAGRFEVDEGHGIESAGLSVAQAVYRSLM
jgi:hypothetical protein